MLQTNFNHHKSCFSLFSCNNTIRWLITSFIPPWKHWSCQRDVQHGLLGLTCKLIISDFSSWEAWWEGRERRHSPCSLESPRIAHLLSQPGCCQKEEQLRQELGKSCSNSPECWPLPITHVHLQEVIVVKLKEQYKRDEQVGGFYGSVVMANIHWMLVQDACPPSIHYLV